MTFSRIIFLAVIARFVVWVIQTQKISTYLLAPLTNRYPKLQELIDCDFCLGFWVTLFLSKGLAINLLEEYRQPLLTYPLSALVLSFILHIFVSGLTQKFSTIVYEVEV
jgi:hypothetical protein